MITYKTTRTWAAILAVLLTLTLLLTACSTGGDTPTGDNSTPGVTEMPGNTPDVTNPSPDDTTEPENTPSEAEPSTPGTSETSKYIMPPYDEAKKAVLDDIIADFGQLVGIDVNKTLDEIQEKYGQYLNVNISKDAVLTGIRNRGLSSYFHGKSDVINPTGISPDAVAKVNEFLVSMGEEPIGITDEAYLKAHNELMADIGIAPFPAAITTPEDNIAAFWLAASLFYDPDIEMANVAPCYDISLAFALTTTDPSKTEDKDFQDTVWILWSDYVNLYDGGDEAIELNP